ncbi:MAG TPA: nucleoside kinase [Bacilli bacterium]|nr:nucleoside kinase [Bacilli bacterium]
MSFKVTYEGKVQTFTKPVSVLEIVGPDRNHICALVNGRVRELTYMLTDDTDLVVKDIDDSEGMRIYQTSLRYITAMAMKRIRPELRIRFSYNVSRSIFIQVLNKNVNLDRLLVDKLENEMRKIIEANYPLKRHKISVEEAARLYEKHGFPDKLEVLKYRPEPTVHVYECDGYLNYMYGYMVPSTGYLDKFVLRPYSPGMLLSYPRSETKGVIPEFKDAPMFGKTLKAAHGWAELTKLDSVANINKYIENGEDVDLINICEARHYQMLTELGDRIMEDIDDIRLIGIAGPSSSGKTTFANRLRTELMSRGLRPIRLSIDDYYLPRDQAPRDENGDFDLESIYALDIELFNKNMYDLINGEEVQLPHFDFKIGGRVPGRKLKIEPDQPLIIEGIHALNEQLTSYIPKHQKFKIYISPQAQINIDDQNPISLTDLRLLRRIVRDNKYRNASALDTMKMWPSVRAGEFKWIYDTQEEADYVYNSLLSYELAVMKKHALPLLHEFDYLSEFFPLAERLIRMLKYFKDLDEKWVPSNSLLREFIGGSCYEDA